MKKIELSESDCTFVHYVLRMYASQTSGLDRSDKQEIYEVANKFKQYEADKERNKGNSVSTR